MDQNSDRAAGIVVAVLAGGQSQRMGQDKAALVWDGLSLLERTVRTAQEAGCRVIVVGRPAPTGWPLPETPFLPDEDTGHGPIDGIAAALRFAEGANILALACDLPLLSASAARWLCAQAIDLPPFLHGVNVRSGEHIEPLFSVYTSACLPLIAEQIADGRYSLQALIRAGVFVEATAPPDVAAALVNVNTPEDFARLPRPLPARLSN